MKKQPYPDYMMETIELVEESRPDRLRTEPRRPTPEEKEALLRNYHPDYRPGTKRVLKIGPNAGDTSMPVPHEVADVIEAWPLIDPNAIDLSEPDYDVDILIVGAGGAGSMAAFWAYETLKNKGIRNPEERILIITKLRYGDANTIMAQGGIQAADRFEDSPTLHWLDTMGGGHFTNDPELVKILVTEAPKIIKFYEELGAMFDKFEDGSFLELPGGGACRYRLHSCKDYTGLELFRVLRDAVINRNIPYLEFTPAIELISDGHGGCAGVVALNLDTQEYVVIRAKATIITTGGYGRLHIQDFPTTNHYGATMDGVVIAYRLGAKLRDLDSTQYHPTGAAYPEQIVGALLTEKLRGAGSQLVNKNGEAFIYPLEPRDVVASAIIKECAEGRGIETPTGKVGVWLDTPMIDMIHGKGTLKRWFAWVYRTFMRYGIDPSKYPILAYPTLHYQNGGICIDKYTRVLNAQNKPIPRLFAAGEVTGGVHGKNRLMGNSLLEISVFGKIAGITVAEYVLKADKPRKMTLDHVVKWMKDCEKLKIPRERKSPIVLPDYRFLTTEKFVPVRELKKILRVF